MNVVNIRSVKRLPRSLWVPKLRLRQGTAGRIARSTRSISGARARTNSINFSLLQVCNVSRVSRPNLSDRVMPETV